jgi:type IV pilus assembly protein PilP
MKTFQSMFISGVLGLALVGCAEDAPPRPAAAAAAPAQASATAPKAVAEEASPETAVPPPPAYVYNYNPVGKRDPFRSPLEDLDASVVQANPVVACNEPLCQWDIDQLKLVAVVTGDANPLAMVEDPMGRGHIVRRNTKMGRQGGKVTQILRDEVIVTEIITTPERAIANEVHLKLRADDALDPAYNLMTGKNWEP